MDDPWANAWGEDDKKDPKWKPPPRVVDEADKETDIAIPSWSTGVAVSWAEPSGNQDTLWGASESKSWEPTPSPYETILSPKAPADPEPISSSLPRPDALWGSAAHSDDGWQPTLEPYAPINIPHVDTEASSEPASPAEPVGSASDSPTDDAFGSFESGVESEADLELEHIEDPWSPQRSAFVPPSADSQNAWGAPAWSPRDHEEDSRPDSPDHDEERVDEWEAAIQQKQKQDLHVPPELLASILGQFEELSHDLWPKPTTEPPEGKRMIRIEDLDYIGPLAAKIVPSDLTLQSIAPFTKTLTAKRMAEGLKLTRHVPFTRTSPMGQYLLSKGSTAWETSVKTRIDVSQDDLLPVGWRLADKGKEIATDTKKKPTGGLLSFFGRRPASPPPDGGVRPMSPVASAVSKSATNTPRASLDSAKPPPPLPPPSPKEVPHPSSLSSINMASDSAPQAPLIAAEDGQPSAVSRFLGRFSRTRSSTGSSLALSSDDLAFLSDVPSASDSVEDDILNITSPPLVATTAKVAPLLAATSTGQPPVPQTSSFDDFGSFFDTPSLPQPSSNSKQPQATSLAAGMSTYVRDTVVAPSTVIPKSRTNASGHSTPKRTFTAIMSSSSSPTNSISIPKLEPALNLLPSPLSARSQVAPVLPKPPLPAPSSNFFGDDDFSDFGSPPIIKPSYDNSFSSLASNQSLFSGGPDVNESQATDDFDDFVFSPTPSPLPPKPPIKSINVLLSKPSSRHVSPAPTAVPTISPQGMLPQYQRTSSGKWPVSNNLPPILAPPNGVATTGKGFTKVQGSTVGMASTPALAMFQSAPPPKVSSSGQGSGGLSAQDLSFFEGL